MAANETPHRALYRSKKQRIIAGVCGGFAEYFGIDVTLIRILWLLLFLFHGIGLIAYIICASVMKNPPEAMAWTENKTNTPQDAPRPQESANKANLWPIIVLLLIFFFLFGMRFSHHALVPFFKPIDWDLDNGHETILSIIIILVGVIFVAIKYTVRTDTQPNWPFQRSKTQRMIGGVCGGLAETWQADATWIRLGFIALSLATSVWAGILIYLILFIVIPEKNE